jgi:hypothetical protein
MKCVSTGSAIASTASMTMPRPGQARARRRNERTFCA